MLTVQGLTVAFGDVIAVDRVSLDVPRGRVLAVLGPSGCGKSTLLRAVAGLEDVQQGSVSFDGQNLAAVPTHRRGFALMFQDGQLFAQQSVAANVGYALKLRAVPAPERAALVQELLDLVGLPAVGHLRPSALSGGEQQRVALARALAAEPALLLLDEPLSALDRELRERLAGDIRGILTRTKTTAVVVTHDHDEACALADDVAVMMHGRILQHGPTRQVWREPVGVEVARFLGYTSVLEGAAAEQMRGAAGWPPVDAPGPSLALRPWALRIERPLTATAPRQRWAARCDAESGFPLSGHVRTVAHLSDRVTAEVLIDTVGVVVAVASPSVRVQVGDQVALSVDVDGLAELTTARDRRSPVVSGSGTT